METDAAMPVRTARGASRFLNAYYMVNVLLFASYALVHRWFFEYSDMSFSRLTARSDLFDRVRFFLHFNFSSINDRHRMPKFVLFSTLFHHHLQERQGLTLLAVSLLIKFFRRQSMDAFLSDAFSLSKGLVALLSFYLDMRIFAYYLIMYIRKYSISQL